MAGSTGSFDTEAKKPVGVDAPTGHGKMILATLRALTFATSLTAFLLMITDKQGVTLPNPDGTSTRAHAKWHYDGTFIYHVVATGIVFIYTLAATAATFTIKTANAAFVFFLLDLVGSYLLISSVSSVVGVAYIAREGNSHLGYGEVCSIFDKFCNQIIASGVITVASFVFLLLAVIVGAFKLMKHWAYVS
ncbi:hypothetical protein MPTK1_3g20970 [Marchantia polymorpha subsp. ruderalis]|nr:hypothetical protein MARPO_0159s0027 [Marchantia polymorpha]BBN06417.1 hypothetical protein Mp_3g20970 [Marchantia polymorpha subsp. ruderalis]|eukprot:PTQ28613.1 hypothetical protein MARPO_0159s0027 [Marchantia polymorpha]